MRAAIDPDADAKMTGDDDDHSDEGLPFPDPLPPPASATTRVTRSLREASGSRPTISIYHSAQMVPIVAALVEVVLAAPVVREALENGAKELKDAAREVREYVKAENERWDVERKALEETMGVPGKGKEGEKVKMKTPPEVCVCTVQCGYGEM